MLLSIAISVIFVLSRLAACIYYDSKAAKELKAIEQEQAKLVPPIKPKRSRKPKTAKITPKKKGTAL